MKSHNLVMFFCAVTCGARAAESNFFEEQVTKGICDIHISCERDSGQVFNEIEALYQLAGQEEYIGEKITQLEHALQTAQEALNAKEYNDGIDDENVIAGLLHDIGHRCGGKNARQMDGFGIEKHEIVGADFLKKRGFSPKIVTLVGEHVNAKRYFAFKSEDYKKTLSNASQQTLLRQGGAMSEKEATEFEKNPYFGAILALRKWEDKAKIVGAKTPDFEFFKTMIVDHLDKQYGYAEVFV